MTISTLPTTPSRSMSQTAFDAAMAAFLAALPTFATEANAMAAAMTAIAAGTAMAIPYTFSTTTTDADPGAGFLRLDNATQNLATTIRADLTGADGSTWTDVLATFDDSTSTIKGHIMLQKLGDATKWMIFAVTALASPSGYKNLTVSCVAASAASPFANNDSLILKFTRTGDKGDTGSSGVAGYLHVRDEKTNGTAGGASSTGVQTRTLNTVKTNTISGASVASDQITLPAGTYRIKARAPAQGATGVHKAYLYNVTDSADVLVGSNANTNSGVMSDSSVSGYFTLASTKSLSLRHYTSSGVASNGLGAATSSGQVEVYAEVEIWKDA